MEPQYRLHIAVSPPLACKHGGMTAFTPNTAVTSLALMLQQPSWLQWVISCHPSR
jgi:hypothetical protein